MPLIAKAPVDRTSGMSSVDAVFFHSPALKIRVAFAAAGCSG
jgi:hypothetical protein